MCLLLLAAASAVCAGTGVTAGEVVGAGAASAAVGGVVALAAATEAVVAVVATKGPAAMIVVVRARSRTGTDLACCLLHVACCLAEVVGAAATAMKQSRRRAGNRSIHRTVVVPL